jgi:hypothetical protein
MGISATRSFALLLLEKGKWHCGWGESVMFVNMMHKFQKIHIILKETPLFRCNAIFGHISKCTAGVNK